MLDNIKRDRAPSIDSVQKLAQYLGVTTSDLLGEVRPAVGGVEITPAELALIEAYRAADDATKQVVSRVLELPPSQTGRGVASA